MTIKVVVMFYSQFGKFQTGSFTLLSEGFFNPPPNDYPCTSMRGKVYESFVVRIVAKANFHFYFREKVSSDNIDVWRRIWDDTKDTDWYELKSTSIAKKKKNETRKKSFQWRSSFQLLFSSILNLTSANGGKNKNISFDVQHKIINAAKHRDTMGLRHLRSMDTVF